jgi:hypothetical protein
MAQTVLYRGFPLNVLTKIVVRSCTILPDNDLDIDVGEDPLPALRAAVEVLRSFGVVLDADTAVSIVEAAAEWFRVALEETTLYLESVDYRGECWDDDSAGDMAIRETLGDDNDCPDEPYPCIRGISGMGMGKGMGSMREELLAVATATSVACDTAWERFVHHRRVSRKRRAAPSVASTSAGMPRKTRIIIA